MKSFDYHEPRTLKEAATLLDRLGPGAKLLAGGTDLLIQMEGARLQPEAVVYLGRIGELRGIGPLDEGGLRIGAGATLRAVEMHPVVQHCYPALAEAARVVGSIQIRNLATLAGNACNASPSADTSPALLAYDAEVETVDASGRGRTIPVAELWTGPGRTTLLPHELVAAIRLPAPPPGQRSFYYKLAVRKAMDLAMVGICATLVPKADGAGSVRLALGAVAPVCLRAHDAEAAIQAGGAGAIQEAARLAQGACSPIDDQRASAAYRREMVRVLTARALTHLLA